MARRLWQQRPVSGPASQRPGFKIAIVDPNTGECITGSDAHGPNPPSREREDVANQAESSKFHHVSTAALRDPFTALQQKNTINTIYCAPTRSSRGIFEV